MDYKDIQKLYYTEHIKKYPPINFPNYINRKELKLQEEKSYNDIVFGDWVLFEEVGDTVNYPVLAIFNCFDIADQALEYKITTYPRTWENNIDARYIRENETSLYNWDHIILCHGVWKSKPNFKQLLNAFRKSVYFSKHPIKEKIKDLLN